MATKTVQDSSLTSIANAIRTKGGTTAPLEFPTDFVTAIQDIPTGGGGASVSPKEVNFYDYDGTVVDAYTASEFAALSAMPANPSHTGLTAQGWNWSLADAKAYVAKYGRLNIGQMYVTTSGDTEIDIELHDGRLEPVLGIAPNGTVEIDWGDGSAIDTVTGTSSSTLKDTQHVYASEGRYTIVLHVVSGGFSIRDSRLLYKGGTAGAWQRVYLAAIQAVRLGENATIGNNAFAYCYSLKSISIPENVTAIGNNAFAYCDSLASISIPENVTIIGSSAFAYCYSLKSISIPEKARAISSEAFNYCYSLKSISIPENVTTIGSSAFNYCYSLASISIPENVTTISGSAFAYCSGIAEYKIKPMTPPTLSNSAVFSNNASDRIFIVPKGSLETYQTASNWSTYAEQMQEEA